MKKIILLTLFLTACVEVQNQVTLTCDELNTLITKDTKLTQDNIPVIAKAYKSCDLQKFEHQKKR